MVGAYFVIQIKPTKIITASFSVLFVDEFFVAKLSCEMLFPDFYKIHSFSCCDGSFLANEATTKQHFVGKLAKQRTAELFILKAYNYLLRLSSFNSSAKLLQPAKKSQKALLELYFRLKLRIMYACEL